MKRDDEPKITIMSRTKVGLREENQLEARDPESKELVRTLVKNIQLEIFK